MFLSLEAAAKHANVTVEDVFSYISSGKLKAKTATEAGVVNYSVEIKELDKFLAGITKEADSDFEDDFFSDSLDQRSNSPVIRRVLTAEAVSDLRVQTQILASRIDTLERLFSEFIDLEKNESTLILENSWKISEELKVNENQGDMPNKNFVTEQSVDVVEGKKIVSKRDERTGLEKVEVLSTREEDDRMAEDDEISAARLSASRVSDKEQSKIHSVKIDQDVQQKEKIAGGIKAKLLEKAGLEKEKDASDEVVTDEIAADGRVEEVKSVSDRLAQYQIKLERAKQVANQLWH